MDKISGKISLKFLTRCSGAIYGRNVWGESVEKGIAIAQAATDVIKRPEFAR